MNNRLSEARADRVKEVLHEALELTREERMAFIDRVAADDPSIRIEVRILIEAHERAGDFLVNPTADDRDAPPGVDPATSMGLPSDEAPGQMIGRYKLLQVIGEGGFGRVYMAEQREPVTRRVALKIIKLGMDTRQVIARFEAERQALALMEHANIATVLDAGATASGRPYFVMELVKGIPITEYCNQNRLPLADRLELFRQVCAAVQHAHMKGVIHRDIKPSNVLVTIHDGRPLPKVIDFGIAKATSSRLTEKTMFTEFRQLIGTPEYMSPEQAESNATDIDTRSDVYSLGVLLYELLTGGTPFDGKRLRSAAFGELQRIIREEEPDRPSTRLSTLEALPSVAAQRSLEPRKLKSIMQGELDWITLKALEKNRDRRYGSAAELAEDVRRHLEHQPVLAGPPSSFYRLRKLVRRHRVRAVSALLITLAVIGGSIGTTVGMLRARAAAADAREASAQSAAVNDFLRDVLTSVEPEERGADVRLVEVLANASQTCPERFQNRPILEADVRLLLARVYTHLDMQREATAEYQAAVNLYRSALPGNDRRLIQTRMYLTQSYLNQALIRDFEAHLVGLSTLSRQSLGPDDQVTLEIERLEAATLVYRNRAEEAIAQLRDLRERARRAGMDERIQINLLRGLVQAMIAKRTPDGRVLFEVAAEIEPLARELVERCMKEVGPTSLMTIHARLRLADSQMRQGKIEEASKACREVLAATEGTIGSCHAQRLLAMTILAKALNLRQFDREAAELRLIVLECSRAKDEPIAWVATISDTLPYLDRGEKPVEGERYARELADALRSFGGGHGDMLFSTELYVVRFISLQGRLDEADTLLRSMLESSTTNGASPRTTARVHVFLASNLTRQGRFDEAEDHLNQAAALIPDIRRGTSITLPDDLALEYMLLYDAWGKTDERAKYEALLHDIRVISPDFFAF